MSKENKITAIVIDDDVDVRDVFVDLLLMSDVDIIATGSNGKEALELYKLHKPDIVLIDYLMPEFDGIYGINVIREFDSNAKIVMVSGSYFQQGVLGDSVVAIIKKPIDIKQVTETIDKIKMTKISLQI